MVVVAAAVVVVAVVVVVVVVVVLMVEARTRTAAAASKLISEVGSWLGAGVGAVMVSGRAGKNQAAAISFDCYCCYHQ